VCWFLDDDIIPSPGLLPPPWKALTATGLEPNCGQGAAALAPGTARMRTLRHPFASTACNPARAVSSWEATLSFTPKMAPCDLGGFDENYCACCLSLRKQNLQYRWRRLGWYSLYFEALK